MKYTATSFLFVLIGSFISAQSVVYFKYDEAGNQRYRGDDATASAAQQEVLREAATAQIPEDGKFWSQVQVYPVPVRDQLTISWKEEVNELIDNVTLYQHAISGNVFQKKYLPNINRNVQINMGGMYMGVYILSFQLKDGRVMTRNILKLPN